MPVMPGIITSRRIGSKWPSSTISRPGGRPPATLTRVAAPLEPARQHVAVQLVVVHHQDVGQETPAVARRGRLRRRVLTEHLGQRGHGGRRGLRSRGIGQGQVEDFQQVPGRGPNLLEVGRKIRLTTLLRFLLQELAVAEDLMDGRSEIVTELS